MSHPSLTGRLAQEHHTIGRMLALYCRAHCGQTPRSQGRCINCQNLLDYAAQKLDRCPYGPTKPTCAKCPIHCYKPEPRAQIRLVMRYAGPRMLLRHPVAALQHLLAGCRSIPAKPPMRAHRQSHSHQSNSQKNKAKP